MNKFIIVAQLRSGYQFLSSLLNSNGNVLCFGEIFGSDRDIRQKSFFGDRFPVLEEQEEVVSYIRKLTSAILARNHAGIGKLEKIQAYGFKLNYVDCQHNKNWAHIWDYLVQDDWKIIHLKRDNLLDRLISEKLASKTGKWSWHQYNTQVEVHIQELEFACKQSKQWQNWADEHFKDKPMMNLTYEELTTNTPEVCDKVQDFIGVRRQKLWSGMPKQRTSGQSTYLSNYKELYNECVEHPIFKSYLTDIPVM